MTARTALSNLCPGPVCAGNLDVQNFARAGTDHGFVGTRPGAYEPTEAPAGIRFALVLIRSFVAITRPAVS